MKEFLIHFLALIVLVGIIPLLTLLAQFVLVGFHGIKNHYSKCDDYTPNVAIIIPVWNEEDVIGMSIDSLMQLDYPEGRLRIYAVDDVSIDNTPHVLAAKALQYPNRVFNFRRPEKVGFGKAVVINHGLKIILQEPWAEAIMIIDADILFEKDTLLKMARHLADPQMSAVTAYIKEGHGAGNLVVDFIGFEYIVAQAGARRAQNVLGVMACLAGGAQLHKRTNIEELGGQIDTSTLAEDTYTTFVTQLNQHHVVFEGNAVAIAEEPETIYDLWKQRFRWAEGNVQVTRRFKKLWFRRSTPGGLGGIFFGLIWFSTLLMPLTMISSSIALNILFFLHSPLSWNLFRIFIFVSLISYLFGTLYSFCLDPHTARRTWFAGFMFPGLISLFHMFIVITPYSFEMLVRYVFSLPSWHLQSSFFIIWLNSWISLCMLFAWLVYRLDRINTPQIITNVLLILIGYGPLLCAITFASYISQFMNKEMKWNKTVKTGKAKQIKALAASHYDFKKTLALDKKEELRLFFYELFLLGLFIILCFLDQYYGLS